MNLRAIAVYLRVSTSRQDLRPREPELQGCLQTNAGFHSGQIVAHMLAQVAERVGVLDQVHQLISSREADSDRGFMARLMALCSLPRTNPGKQNEYKRANGDKTQAVTRHAEYES